MDEKAHITIWTEGKSGYETVPTIKFKAQSNDADI